MHLGGSYRCVRSDAPLETDRWYHVAGVYDGESYALFLDGRELGRASVDPKWRRKTNELPLYIGGAPDGSGEPVSHVQGWIDEVRLSSSALYGDDIEPQRRLQARDDTVLLYPFDIAVGRFAYESGPHGAHGEMIGDARLSEPLETESPLRLRSSLSRQPDASAAPLPERHLAMNSLYADPGGIADQLGEPRAKRFCAPFGVGGVIVLGNRRCASRPPVAG